MHSSTSKATDQCTMVTDNAYKLATWAVQFPIYFRKKHIYLGQCIQFDQTLQVRAMSETSGLLNTVLCMAWKSACPSWRWILHAPWDNNGIWKQHNKINWVKVPCDIKCNVWNTSYMDFLKERIDWGFMTQRPVCVLDCKIFASQDKTLKSK